MFGPVKKIFPRKVGNYSVLERIVRMLLLTYRNEINISKENLNSLRRTIDALPNKEKFKTIFGLAERFSKF